MRFFSALPHKRIAWTVFYSLLILFVGYFFIRYLLAVFLPFLIAFITVLSLRRISWRLSRGRARLVKLIRVSLVILILSAILFLIVITLVAAIRQLGDFLAGFAEEESAILNDFSRMLDTFSRFLAGLPFFHGENTASVREDLLSMLSEFLKNAVMGLAAKLPEWVGALISAVPKIMLFFAVTVISAIYFCLDIEKIIAFFKAHLGDKTQSVAKAVFGECGHAVLKYLKAYTLLFFFTFAELFIGFAVLGERYAFLLALLTALIDVLPVLGTGTVLLPWALWLFLTGHISHAIGLVVLYVIITLSRQVLEPKIIGAGMGMPPLLMLIAMYAGLKLFGFWGMLLTPPLAMVVKNSILAFGRIEQRGAS